MAGLLQKIASFIATGLGSGYLPFGGSWGALLMLIGCWWLLRLPVVWFVILFGIIFVLGIFVVDAADRRLAVRTGRAHDNSQIVIDEFVGMMITLLPLYLFEVNLVNMIIGYVLFRFFDAVKFGLARLADQTPNRWGIMFDDVAAGFHAGLAFYVVLLLMQRFL